MTEITKHYKLEVKKLRNISGIKGRDTNILPSKATCSQFAINSRDVLKTISQLDALLEEAKVKYIGSTYSSQFSSLSDQQRLEIDMSANMYIMQCREAINSLDTLKSKEAGQLRTHHEGIILVLSAYLKLTCDKFSHIKALHVSQSIEQHKLTKLSSHKNVINKIKSMEEVEDYTQHEQHYISDDLGLSPEELQELEQENDDMYSELTALSSEVHSIEGTVMEISRLQEIFTEKVLTQTDQISALHGTAVDTTENTRSGNEELREAIKNSAGFRVWLLFFFVMASCCLLFLDWYS